MFDALLAQQVSAQEQSYRAQWPEAEFLVIENGGEPVGRMVAHCQGTDWHLVDIVLLPAVQGLGLGTALIATLQAGARAAGATLSLHAENGSPAVRLYRRLGFVADGPGDKFRQPMIWR